MPPGSGKRLQRRRGSTSRSLVIDAALAVADEVGVEKVSIRAIAKRAAVPTMSLYSHFASKKELLDLMYSEFLLRLYGEELPATWPDGLLAIASRVRSLLLAHPHWVELLSHEAQPFAAPVREKLLALMTSDGMTAARALSVLASTILMAEGLMLLEFSLVAARGPSRVERRFERMKVWVGSAAAAAHPVTKAAFETSKPFDFGDNFAFTIQNYIDGIRATTARATSGSSASR